MVTQASDNTDLGYKRILDPDMQHGPGCRQGLRWPHRTLRLVCVPSPTKGPRHQYGLRQQPRPLTSGWPLVATRATDISTDPGCGTAMSAAWPGPLHGPHICLFLTAVQFHLTPQYTTACFAFSPISPTHTPSLPPLHHTYSRIIVALWACTWVSLQLNLLKVLSILDNCEVY